MMQPEANLAIIAADTKHVSRELRGKIYALEEAMKQEISKNPEIELKLEPRHFFADGLYARELRIPKGALLTGMIHKFNHINIISQGDISVLTENGIERIKAPCTIVSSPGTKRVGYAHEETVWTTFHANPDNLRDTDALEKLLVTNTHAELTADEVKQLLGGLPCLS